MLEPVGGDEQVPHGGDGLLAAILAGVGAETDQRLVIGGGVLVDLVEEGVDLGLGGGRHDQDQPVLPAVRDLQLDQVGGGDGPVLRRPLQQVVGDLLVVDLGRGQDLRRLLEGQPALDAEQLGRGELHVHVGGEQSAAAGTELVHGASWGPAPPTEVSGPPSKPSGNEVR